MEEALKDKNVSVIEAATRAGAAYVWKTQYAAGADKGWAEGWAAGWAAVRGSNIVNNETTMESAIPPPMPSLSRTNLTGVVHSRSSTGRVYQTKVDNCNNSEGVIDDESDRVEEGEEYNEKDYVGNDKNFNDVSDDDDFFYDANACDSSAGDDAVELEMDPEWAQLFKRGEQRRKRQRLEASRVETSLIERTRIGKDDQDEQPVNLVPTELLDLGGLRDAERRVRAQEWYGVRTDDILELEAEMDANFQRVVAESNAQFWPVV